jgi:hypothetical protein
MLRRLRAFAARAPRVIVSLVLLAFVVPVLAGPLAYCLEGDDGSRVVAAASHCESMADATATAKPAAPEHLPAIDDSVNAASGSTGWALVVQSSGLLLHDSGIASPLPELLPSRLDAYGSDAPDRYSMRSLAGAIAGRSARLQS